MFGRRHQIHPPLPSTSRSSRVVLNVCCTAETFTQCVVGRSVVPLPYPVCFIFLTYRYRTCTSTNQYGRYVLRLRNLQDPPRPPSPAHTTAITHESTIPDPLVALQQPHSVQRLGAVATIRVPERFVRRGESRCLGIGVGDNHLGRLGGFDRRIADHTTSSCSSHDLHS